MSDIWFTSDHHFGHKKILLYEPEARPFQTVSEMHEVLIERWNSVVRSKDIVYHVGDFAFGKQNISIAEKLNGKKKLVMGNHDTYPTADYLKYFYKCYGVLFWERCIISHVPTHQNGLGKRWLLNIHGHLHSKIVQTTWVKSMDIETGAGVVTLSTPEYQCQHPNYFNVSVEKHNLTPVNWEIIKVLLKNL